MLPQRVRQAGCQLSTVAQSDNGDTGCASSSCKPEDVVYVLGGMFGNVSDALDLHYERPGQWLDLQAAEDRKGLRQCLQPDGVKRTTTAKVGNEVRCTGESRAWQLGSEMLDARSLSGVPSRRPS